MSKNLFTISLKWGMLLGAFQILSHSLLVYVFIDAGVVVRNIIEITTILISFFLLYVSIRKYKQTFNVSEPFSILKAFYAGICPSLYYVILFIIYFIILIHFVDTEFLTHYALVLQGSQVSEANEVIHKMQPLTPVLYVIKCINHYLIFQLTAALILAALMQRKPEDCTTQVDNNENN